MGHQCPGQALLFFVPSCCPMRTVTFIFMCSTKNSVFVQQRLSSLLKREQFMDCQVFLSSQQYAYLRFYNYDVHVILYCAYVVQGLCADFLLKVNQYKHWGIFFKQSTTDVQLLLTLKNKPNISAYGLLLVKLKLFYKCFYEGCYLSLFFDCKFPLFLFLECSK